MLGLAYVGTVVNNLLPGRNLTLLHATNVDMVFADREATQGIEKKTTGVLERKLR